MVALCLTSFRARCKSSQLGVGLLLFTAGARLSDQEGARIAASLSRQRRMLGNNWIPAFDTYRNFLAKPPIEGLLVLKAIRTLKFAA